MLDIPELRIGLEREYIDINTAGKTPQQLAADWGRTETAAELTRHLTDQLRDLTIRDNEGNTFSFL